MQTWRAWMCTQTKQTMQQVRQGVPHSQLGGQSNAMALRHAAVFGYYDTEQGVVDAARTAMFTHREKTAHAGAEFFARVSFIYTTQDSDERKCSFFPCKTDDVCVTQVTFRVIHNGITPKQAIEQVAAESNDQFIKDKVKQALDKVAEATDPTKDLINEKFVDDKAITSMARLWDVGKTEPIKVGRPKGCLRRIYMPVIDRSIVLIGGQSVTD